MGTILGDLTVDGRDGRGGAAVIVVVGGQDLVIPVLGKVNYWSSQSRGRLAMVKA